MSRNILIVLSAQNGADALLQASSEVLYKPGDRFQLLWVTNHNALLKEAQAAGDIEPTLPGLDAQKSHAVEESEAAQLLQKEVAAKYGPGLDALQIPYQVLQIPYHIMPTSALHLGPHIVQVAAVESAALVVLPKTAGDFIKAYVPERCQSPVVLV